MSHGTDWPGVRLWARTRKLPVPLRTSVLVKPASSQSSSAEFARSSTTSGTVQYGTGVEVKVAVGVLVTVGVRLAVGDGPAVEVGPAVPVAVAVDGIDVGATAVSELQSVVIVSEASALTSPAG